MTSSTQQSSNHQSTSATATQFSDRQYEHLQNLIARYTQQTKTSKTQAQAHRHVLADNRATAGLNAITKEMHYPIVGKHSQGSKIWDVDDNEYIDFTMGFGVNLLGHQPPFIIQALQQQLEKGIQLGPQAESVGEVADLIAELTGMERVAFSNTGTEAIMTAIRLARATTGRKKIALFAGSYHGHFDGTLVKPQTTQENFQAVPKTIGIPEEFVKDVLVLEYDDPQSLDVINAYSSDLAAVLVEPIQPQRPQLQPKSFLHQLRELTQSLGITLIFDEMVTGFRLHPGGAQAWFDVQADLATYGKIVGGGMPIGVIAGNANYLDRIDGGMWHYGDASLPQVKTAFFAGTYCKHPLAIAAARAMLQYLKAQGSSLQNQLNDRTEQFVQALNDCFQAEKLPVQMANFGSFFGPVAAKNITASNTSNLPLELLRYHLLYRGILLRGSSGFLSTAHSDEDLDSTIQAIKASVAELRQGHFLPN
ncbi:MAG: aminotransferase class III-fold pyridoxal phosphate-dependent enzyme [Cyanobacteria bacterium]|jgi:glutamate-1-semialdehyde-2,1-aminomutase|nr:aminotransferase class III-fold pyridoxal phosphate-dependent enzyme [Cyanobacteria bacterium GSL.Bin1]